MSFVIPNLPDAGFTDQAEPDSRDFRDILAPAADLSGVLSGCAVTAQGTPDMTVAVAAGRVLVLGVWADVTAGNVTITAADGTNPRFDLIVVDNTGAKSAVAGTAAANAVFPDPAGKVVLAAVYVPASDTDIDANQIIDKRVPLRTVRDGEDSADWLLKCDKWSYTTGLGTLGHAPIELLVNMQATDTTSPTDQVSAGLRTAMRVGVGGVATKGTTVAFVATNVISGSGNAGNEYNAVSAVVRMDIGTGFTQTAAPTGRIWGTDQGIHGPIAVAPGLLQGLSYFVQNYYDGSPTQGPSCGIIVHQKQGGGPAASATHQAADTFPVDAGIAVMGKSFNAAADDIGFTKGIQVGGSGGGFTVAGSIIGTGIEITDWRTAGITIGAREASGTGPGLAVLAAGEGAVIGAATITGSTELFEVYKSAPSGAIAGFRAVAATDNLSVILTKSGAVMRLFAVGTAGSFLTSSAQNDVGITVSDTNRYFLVGVQAGAIRFRVGPNVVVGSAALATTATDGFLYIPSCAGPPTGTPTSFTGRVPMIYDSTNERFYIYDGSWRGVELAA